MSGMPLPWAFPVESARSHRRRFHTSVPRNWRSQKFGEMKRPMCGT